MTQEPPAYLYNITDHSNCMMEDSFGLSESSISAASSSSTSSSYYPPLLFPKFRSFEDDSLLHSISENGEEGQTIFTFYDDDDDVETCNNNTTRPSTKKEKSYVTITEDDGAATMTNPCTSAAQFSLTKLWGACGGGGDGAGSGTNLLGVDEDYKDDDHHHHRLFDDDDRSPKDVLSWMQEKMEQIATTMTQTPSSININRCRDNTNNTNPWSSQHIQNEWGTKPSLDRTYNDDDSSLSLSGFVQVQESTMTTTKKKKEEEDSNRENNDRIHHLFVDNESTSWEGTDHGDTIVNDHLLRPFGYRKSQHFTSSSTLAIKRPGEGKDESQCNQALDQGWNIDPRRSDKNSSVTTTTRRSSKKNNTRRLESFFQTLNITKVNNKL